MRRIVDPDAPREMYLYFVSRMYAENIVDEVISRWIGR